MRESMMEDLFKTLPKLLDQFEDSAEVRKAVVFASWKRAAGDSLSAHTVPIRLDDKRLTVAVRDITWERHLKSLAGQMIFKLNSVLGKAVVTFIKFQIDENRVEKDRGSSRELKQSDEKRKQLALDEVSPKLRASAGKITDDQLRHTFLLAAGSCLARKKRLAREK